MNPRGNPQNLVFNRVMTPMQEIDAIAWYKAKRALGTFKTKAREMGLNPSTLSEFIFRWKYSEGHYKRRRRKRARLKMVR